MQSASPIRGTMAAPAPPPHHLPYTSQNNLEAYLRGRTLRHAQGCEHTADRNSTIKQHNTDGTFKRIH